MNTTFSSSNTNPQPQQPLFEAPTSVDAFFNYLRPGSPPPRVFQPTPENPSPAREGEYAPYRKTVANGRVSARNYRLDIEGFEVREHAERSAITRALSHCNDNITEAAGLLGITRPTLYNMLDKYGLKSQA